VILLALVLFINFVDRGNLGVAAPIIKDQLQLSATQLGLLFSAFFWSYTLCLLPAGWLAEYFGAGRVLMAAAALWSLATIFTGLAHGFAALLAFRLLLGIGEAGAYPCVNKLLATHLNPDERGRANGTTAFGQALGPGAGTWLGGLVIVHFGWRAMFAAFGALSLLWIWPWWRLKIGAGRAAPEPQPARYDASVHRHRAGSSSASGSAGAASPSGAAGLSGTAGYAGPLGYSDPSGSSGPSHSSGTLDASSGHPSGLSGSAGPPVRSEPAREHSPPLSLILRQRALWGTSLGHFAANYPLYFMTSWLPIYLVKTRGFSMQQMAETAGASYLVWALSSLGMGWLFDRLLRAGANRTTLAKSFLVSGSVSEMVSLLGVALGDRPVAVACLFLGQLGGGLITPCLFATSQTIAGPLATGRWMGVQLTVGNLAGIIAPALTGLLIDRAGGFPAAFAVCGFTWILGIAAWAFIIQQVEPLDWDHLDRATTRPALEPG
jgi:MFS family permease